MVVDRVAAAVLLAVVTVAGATEGRSVHAQTPASARELPSLSYVCPMTADAEIVEDKPGRCEKCGMDLVPIRLVSAWSCPTHTAVIQQKPGTCPIDHRDLVQITVSMYFTCDDDPHVRALEPGRCADDRGRIAAFERRPHGDHNPRHGGQFFMADDNWHHIEGTYPGPGLFRVFFYNDFTQPISPKSFAGRVAVLGAKGKEVASVPLRGSALRNALDARIPDAPVPAVLKVFLRFAANDKEHAFDFTFTQPSKEPTVRRATAVAASQPVSRAQPADSGFVSGAYGLQIAMPKTVQQLIAALKTQKISIQSLIDQGSIDAVWEPALTAKDIALALELHTGELSDQQRGSISAAVKRLVLAAWQMDSLGDLGDKPQLTAALATFSAALRDIESAYASRR